jgi:cytochrome c peroxidase
MHDGSIGTLPEVLDFYAAGGRHISSGPLAGDGRANPFKSGLVALIRLSEQDKDDLVAFLQTLTDHGFLNDPKHADPFAAK